MSSSKRNTWKEICKKRLIMCRILSLIIIAFISSSTLIFLTLYNYPLYVIITWVLVYATLGYVGAHFFVGIWFGIYASLQPPEKDIHNPINNITPLEDTTRIAIILPVYHEDTRRISAALCAMAEDLQTHPQHNQFDFLILSDSRKINNVSQEMYAFAKIKTMYPNVTFIYRHRIYNGDAKIGNISDFIKRYSYRYKYMIMLDADSIVPAKTLIDMACIMEGNKNIGIIQANLELVIRDTLYSRITKFISSLSFSIGFYRQHYLYMGRSYYYGHNAIIRTQAFAEHCSLPILKKKGPWSAGRPLSHDYIEAALLDGAGYEIWSLPQLTSFEELPTNFIDDFQREMRWMYGSMTYLRVLFLSKIQNLYKRRLFTSSINYFNPLFGWLALFLSLLGLRYAFMHPIRTYVITSKFSILLSFLISFIIISIMSPGILSILYWYKKKKSYLYGGTSKMFISYILYIAYSTLASPLYMCQISKMLLFWLIGKKLHWGEQNREDRGLTWPEAINQTGWMSLLGIALTYAVNKNVLEYYTPNVQHILHTPKFILMIFYIPLLAGMILAPLLVRFTSRHYDWLKKMSLFISPQEIKKDFVIQRTEELLIEFQDTIPETIDFHFIISSPWFFFRHLRTLPSRPHKTSFWSQRLKNKTLNDLTDREKYVILRTRELWEAFHIKTIFSSKTH